MSSHFLPFLGVSALALATSMQAAAQSDDSSRELDTVIVTLPGPDRTADELIGNATQIDREDILENLQSTLGDTLAKEPGVSTTFFGQGASRPVLRGLGAERVQVLTNGIGVIDVSAASPDHQVAADGIDAARIEILRGPAALAYGGQSIGGVVNVIDGLIAEDLPEEAYSGDFFAAYNTVNEGTELAGRGQFVAGPLVLTLSASGRDFDNYEIPGFAESDVLMAAEEAEEDHDDEHEGEEHEDEERMGLLENSFLETQTLSAGVSYVGDRGFFGVAVRQQTSEYGLPGHAHDHAHEDEKTALMDGDEDRDHAEGEEEENPFIDLEQLRFDIRGGVALGETGFTRLSGSLAIVDYEHAEFEAPGEIGTMYETEGSEGRLELETLFGELKGAVGVQFLNKDFNAVGEEAFITPTTTDSFGVFLYQTREWDSGFGVEGGARYEQVKLDNIIGGEQTFDLISGSFGVHRHFDSGWFFGAQASLSERAPNESELFANGPHLATEQFEIGDRFLDEERGVNLEGTARWSNDTMRVGINLFVNDFSNFIYLTPTGAEEDELPVFIFVQDDAQFVGGEIYGATQLEGGPLGADWTFDASLDFVEAELDGGGNVPFIPPVTLNLGTSAEWGAWEVGADVTFADEQTDPGLSQFRTDAYTLLNLRGEVDLADFGIGADGTEAFIEARNVTDEEVRYATSVLKDVAPAPGQNFRVGLRVSF